jgi:Flp pilus assembly protein TadG
VKALASVGGAAHADIDPAATRASRRARGGGQSLVEFALILPVLLAFLGLAIDYSRVFQAWITLESATRDAAEAAATTASTSSDALTMARRIVCLQAQTVPGFTRGTSPSPADVEACVSPTVSVSSFSVSDTAAGASSDYPLGSVTVQSTLPFSPLFAYPLITQNGQWIVTTSASFSVLQGRE